jgi:glycosyltransferase involved in cell wall biosynthesis
MRVQVVDAPAVTPPYDHALCAGLARGGAEVELLTRRPLFGSLPRGEGYRVVEAYGGLSSRLRWGRRVAKLAEHLPDTARQVRRARRADVVHYQWLGMEEIAWRTLGATRPRVFTAHDVVPREPRRGQVAAFRRLMEKMDAVIAHSEHGASRLREELGLDVPIEVIPHGAFTHLARRVPRLPAELAGADGPVILFFGYVSPYKGVDVLLEAFADVSGTELWVVGVPRMPLADLERAAARAQGRVRFLPRFVSDEELAGVFTRAQVVALPYREIDQSGVLYTALAFGRAVVGASVGGFTEIAERHGALRLVPPGDAPALADALQAVISDADARARLEDAAVRAAEGPFSWDSVAERTLGLYRSLLAA